MNATLHRLLNQLREGLREMDYGGRRALELRTGYVYTAETKRRQERAQIDRLEDLYGRDLQ